jgi:hypothetical protein
MDSYTENVIEWIRGESVALSDLITGEAQEHHRPAGQRAAG